MATVFLGANDSVDSVRCPTQHVPLEEYSQNMRDIIQYLMVGGWLRLNSTNIYYSTIAQILNMHNRCTQINLKQGLAVTYVTNEEDKK